MGQLLSNLANGSLVKLAENSKPTKFIKLDNDHYGTGTGVTLIRKDAFSEIAWNASDSNGYKNRYFGCTLDNFCDGIWPLKLDEKIRECLVPVPIVVAEGNQVATLHTIYRKGFALSCTEAGVSGWQTEGKAFSYFSDNAKRIAYLDETAYPCVVKADGPALGKGVIVAQTREEARKAVHSMMEEDYEEA